MQSVNYTQELKVTVRNVQLTNVVLDSNCSTLVSASNVPFTNGHQMMALLVYHMSVILWKCSSRTEPARHAQIIPESRVMVKCVQLINVIAGSICCMMELVKPVMIILRLLKMERAVLQDHVKVDKS